VLRLVEVLLQQVQPRMTGVQESLLAARLCSERSSAPSVVSAGSEAGPERLLAAQRRA